MSLTGGQFKQLHDALLDAFDRSTLDQMVRFELNENLGAIAGGGNLSDIAFNLIQWAERRGRTQDRLREVHARLAEQPRGTHHHASGRSEDLRLTGELGTPVHPKRARAIALHVGLTLGAAEDVVTAEVDDPGVGTTHSPHDVPSSPDVDGLGSPRIALGAVNVRVRGGMQDHVGSKGVHGGAQRIGVTHVERGMGVKRHLPLEERLERRGQLAAGSGD